MELEPANHSSVPPGFWALTGLGYMAGIASAGMGVMLFSTPAVWLVSFPGDSMPQSWQVGVADVCIYATAAVPILTAILPCLRCVREKRWLKNSLGAALSTWIALSMLGWVRFARFVSNIEWGAGNPGESAALLAMTAWLLIVLLVIPAFNLLAAGMQWTWKRLRST